jgi:hypothetical protein
MRQELQAAREALSYTERRLQANIDDGSRPDQWAMEDIVRGCRLALAALAKADAALAAPAAQREPEGCTPADAAVLREANHGLAAESHALQEVLADLYSQVRTFCAEQGEADFYTGRALAILCKVRPLEYVWPFADKTPDEVLTASPALDAALSQPQALPPLPEPEHADYEHWRETVARPAHEQNNTWVAFKAGAAWQARALTPKE